MIFTALENMHLLHSFDFLECRTANITRLKCYCQTYICQNFAFCIDFFFVLLLCLLSLTCCKAGMAIAFLVSCASCNQ